jgi:putative hydrolase of the HAD superfamily
VRALVFDYDGVIVDTETTLARIAVDLLAESAIDAGVEDLTRFVGVSGPAADDAFDAWLADRLGTPSAVTAFNRSLAERAAPALAGLVPRRGVVDLISVARAEGWRIGLATGADRSMLLDSLRRMRLLASFDVVCASSEVARGKPAPDVYVEAARRLGVAPKDCVAIEDSLPGCTAALAAGMQVVACPSEVTATTSFPPAVRLVTSLEEISLTDLQ